MRLTFARCLLARLVRHCLALDEDFAALGQLRRLCVPFTILTRYLDSFGPISDARKLLLLYSNSSEDCTHCNGLFGSTLSVIRCSRLDRSLQRRVPPFLLEMYLGWLLCRPPRGDPRYSTLVVAGKVVCYLRRDSGVLLQLCGRYVLPHY